MLYRASECQKRATSPARVDSSGVNLGGKVATPGSPVTVKTMPVCETEKSHTDSIHRRCLCCFCQCSDLSDLVS